ncbi:MAG: DUF2059 domain-containing protein [Rhodobacteraceae bacterium]|nr:DUF2059 domain-containing protein [Paracoccaceae bacterium]
MKQFVFAAVISFLSAAQAYALEPQKMREVLELVGFDQSITFMQLSIRAAGERVGNTNETFDMAWKEASDEVFDADKLLEALIQTNAEAFSEQDYNELVAYYSSGLGRRVTELERATQTAEGEAAIEEIGATLVAELFEENPERLKQIKQTYDQLGTEDSSVAAAMNFGYALIVGMASAEGKPSTVTDEEILSMLQKQEPQLRAQIQERMMLSAAYTYRDLTNTEMDGYIEFLGRPVARKLYQKVEESQRELMRSLVLVFGQKLMQRMGVREL